MSRLLTYTCDRCQKSWPSTDPNAQLWRIQVHAACDVKNYAGGMNQTGPVAEWCRACYETLGFVPQVETKGQQLPEMTLEDKLREIIRSVVQEEVHPR